MTGLEGVRMSFWHRVSDPDERGCREWTLSSGSHGYGQWWPHRDSGHSRFDRNWLTHRMAWFLTYGPIPPHWTIDHICRNRRCCEPTHLRLLTNLANASDNGFKTRTHCPRGHAYAEDNTRTNDLGHRWCRACQKIHNRSRALT